MSSSTTTELDQRFANGLKFVETSKSVKLDNTTKLRFYGLYKVANAGLCKTPAPSRLKIVEYQKWSAWSKVSTEKGITKEKAKELYIKELDAAVPGWDALQAKL